jgi:glycosyltransferase involved in cell wall biosynthesis
MSTTPVKMKIIAVIPCLNEEKFLGEVVTRAVKYVDEVIVIDDASSDKTSSVATAAGAIVIRHDKSQGAGAGTRTGFEAALKRGADIVVTLDGDGQHDANEIPLLVQPIVAGEADLVIGSRFLREAKVAVYRKAGIDFITWAYNVGHRNKIVDGQSGFRAHSRKALEAIHITYPGFGFSIQTLVQVRKKGLKIVERPVSCIYHAEGSTMNPVVHALNVISSVFTIRIKEELFNRRTT